MSEQVKIGLILKPQGIRGEVKVQAYTDDLNRFKKIKKVTIDGVEHVITNVKVGAGFLFVSLYGIEDRNQAELLRNKYICVNKENLPPIKDGSYFIIDIIGCKIQTETGVDVGIVKDVTNSRTDIFTVITTEGKTMRFPFLKDLLVSVDIEGKRIIVNQKRLGEVSCYED